MANTRVINKSVKTVSHEAAVEKARKLASKAALAAQRAKDAAVEPLFAKPEAPKAPVVKHQVDVAAALKAQAVDYEALTELAALADDGTQTPGFVAYLTANGYAVDGSVKIAKTPYLGPMIALKTARATYHKGANGILNCGDNMAAICSQYSREVTVAALVVALELPGNPYLKLNPGQQSMNLRNKARHAINEGRLSFAQIEAAYKQVTAKAVA